MGCVYAGHDLTLDRQVAIKTLLPGANAERFVVESKITAKLPHPGIPPVYALGTLEDGTPYLAMKLIRGRTLADLLKERPSPLHELPRFVQIFEQIAQAVGFAHAQGILHRDLKPLNVMVGAFGEVQVMDWGLAKDLASREQVQTDDRIEEDDVAHTAAGAILGTPGYMAPEQARGEVVDARADVFALGATLAAILTGRPAFVGSTVRETIDQAARGDLDEVLARLESCGADAELTALAKRCLSAQAEQRPADGHEVGAQLAAYRAGVEARLQQARTERAEALVREAEQRKRRRTIQAAGGLIAVVLAAGLGVSLWQRNVASAERDAKAKALEAETQARADEKKAREDAFTALRSMTHYVVGRKITQGTVLTKGDRKFLRNVIKQLDAFAAIKGDDVDTRQLRAQGRYRVGLIRKSLGELKEAKQDYDEAIGLNKQLVADFPIRAEFREELAKNYKTRGVLLEDTGQLQAAEADFTQAVSIQKQLAAECYKEDVLVELGSSYTNRGVLLLGYMGRPKEAEADFTQALSIYEHLVAEFPNQNEYRQDLAAGYNNRGNLRRNTGRLKEAEEDYSQALGLRKQLAAKFPRQPEIREELAKCYNNRGVLFFETNRLKEAEPDFTQALSIRRQLAAEFPLQPEFRQKLASTHYNWGNLLLRMGRLKDAGAEYTEALSIRRQLTADFPNRPEFRHELARSYNNRGGYLLMHTGRLQDAEADYTQAMYIQKQLVADFPNQPDFRNDLASFFANLSIPSPMENRMM